MEDKTSYNPISFLSKYIDRFYVFKQSTCDQLNLPPVLPGTGLELVFHLEHPWSINNRVLPKVHTFCPRVMTRFDAQTSAEFIAVRFKSGAFRHFTFKPFSELNNQYIPVSALWGSKGQQMEDAFYTLVEIPDKIKCIEQFLIEVFNIYHNVKDDKWDGVIEDLYYNFDTNSIEHLAEKSGLSIRQFERHFKAQFGITAKEFQNITRFQTVTKKILFSKTPDYLGTILDGGYFDQSHFIKAFKAYTNTTPKQYFLNTDFDSRFYHESNKEV